MDWTEVLAEERARQATRPFDSVVRPSLPLRISTVAYLDRVAQLQDMTRSELVEAMVGLYRASWRPLKGRP